MPIPVADRMGRLNAPNAQAGRAPSTAQYEENIGRIGENTMRLMQRSGNEMARAVTYMQRQKESMAAQDALTEYLAGRQKLDTVRDSLALENAVDFEDKYYKEAEKMHTEFVNKINRLQYADIRERARGQANDTNIADAARSENFFFKQKEAVADNHTAALIEVKKRDVVNSLSSNPGMDRYNEGNIAQGYIFTLDTFKNRLIEKGYRDGTPEMDMAMSKAKDDYFASVLEELSHRPDNGLNLAHKMGTAFKSQMSPAAWNMIMKPISQHNLAEELTKDPTRFFKNGDVLNGEMNMKAAANESAGLDDAERRAFLESFQKNMQSGYNSAMAAGKIKHSKDYMQVQAEWLNDNLGIYGSILAGTSDLDKLTKEETKEISKYLQKNVNVTLLANKLAEWAGEMDTLEEEDKNKLRSLETKLVTMVFDDPSMIDKGLVGTMFEGKNPSTADVGYSAFLKVARDSAKDKTWKDTWLNPFDIFGESPIAHRSSTNVRAGLRAVNRVISDPRWVNKIFDDLSETEKNQFFAQIATEVDRETSSAYALRLGSTAEALRERTFSPISSIADDIMRKERSTVLGRMIDVGTLGVAKTVTAYGLAGAYYGHYLAKNKVAQLGAIEAPSMSLLQRDEDGNIIQQTSSPYSRKELKTIFPDVYSFYKQPIKRQK